MKVVGDAQAAKTKPDLKTFSETYLSPYLKYTGPSFNPGSPPTPTLRANRAATTIYAPYFGARTKVEGPVEKLWPFKLNGYELGEEPTYLNRGNFLDLKLDFEGKFIPDIPYHAEKLIKVEAGPQYNPARDDRPDVLGTNLFTGIAPTRKMAMEIASPKALAAFHNGIVDDKDENAWPVLTIVAGMVIFQNDRKEVDTMVLCCGDNRDKYVPATEIKKLRDDYSAAEQVLATASTTTDLELTGETLEPEVVDYLEKLKQNGKAEESTMEVRVKATGHNISGKEVIESSGTSSLPGLRAFASSEAVPSSTSLQHARSQTMKRTPH